MPKSENEIILWVSSIVLKYFFNITNKFIFKILVGFTNFINHSIDQVFINYLSSVMNILKLLIELFSTEKFDWFFYLCFKIFMNVQGLDGLPQNCLCTYIDDLSKSMQVKAKWLGIVGAYIYMYNAWIIYEDPRGKGV